MQFPASRLSHSPATISRFVKKSLHLKLVFSLLRMMPEDISLDVVKNLSGNGDNPPLNRLCTEMVDAMITTSTHVQEH